MSLGRVPVEDSIAACLEGWCERGFLLTSERLTVASWVDNLFAVGSSAIHAIDLLCDLEAAMCDWWRLVFGSAPKKNIACKGSLPYSREGCRECADFTVMFHVLSPGNGTTACWEVTKRAVCRSFWLNAGAHSKGFSISTKLALLRRCTQPRFEYVCPRWAFSRQLAREVDRLQVKMVTRLVTVARAAGEPVRDYFDRRDVVCRQHAVTVGLWSRIWASSLLSWNESRINTNNAGRKLAVCRQRLLEVCSNFASNQGGHLVNPTVGCHGNFTPCRRTARWTMVKTRFHTTISDRSRLGPGWPRGAGGKKQPTRPMLIS